MTKKEKINNNTQTFDKPLSEMTNIEKKLTHAKSYLDDKQSMFDAISEVYEKDTKEYKISQENLSEAKDTVKYLIGERGQEIFQLLDTKHLVDDNEQNLSK